MFQSSLFHKGFAMQTVLTPVALTSAPMQAAIETRASADVAKHVSEATGLAMDILGLPFDMARAQYARAVQVGLIERSMLASRDFSRTLAAMEQLALGPWARHV
jgi:hypothetical protein